MSILLSLRRRQDETTGADCSVSLSVCVARCVYICIYIVCSINCLPGLHVQLHCWKEPADQVKLGRASALESAASGPDDAEGRIF